MVLKIHILLLCNVCSGTIEQILWSVMKDMNDVYSNIHLLHQRENTGCIECGTRALMMKGESFSCHDGDQICLVHYKCLLKIDLLTGTWITEVGWRHFCNSKGTFARSINFLKILFIFYEFLKCVRG